MAGHYRVFVHEEPRRSRTARLFAPTYLLPLKLPGREKKMGEHAGLHRMRKTIHWNSSWGGSIRLSYYIML